MFSPSHTLPLEQVDDRQFLLMVQNCDLAHSRVVQNCNVAREGLITGQYFPCFMYMDECTCTLTSTLHVKSDSHLGQHYNKTTLITPKVRQYGETFSSLDNNYVLSLPILPSQSCNNIAKVANDNHFTVGNLVFMIVTLFVAYNLYWS